MGQGIRHDRLSHPARPASVDARREEPIPARRRSIASFCRKWLRLAGLLLVLAHLFLRFAWLLLRKHPLTIADRAQWMQDSCIRVLRQLSISFTIEGPPPQDGLIVSNHLSYLDILLHAAAGPRIFVAKADVRAWPIFGWLARCGGTIFIQRGSRAKAAEAAMEIEYALQHSVAVVLFPEGTSTDGTTLLPFYSFLFEPAIESESLVTASAVSYEGDDIEERELCYYGDVHFAPHLMETLGRNGLRAAVRFDRRPRTYVNRKHAANDTWERVARLRLRPYESLEQESHWRTALAGRTG